MFILFCKFTTLSFGECAAEEKEAVVKDLTDIMESAATLSVPLKVEATWGHSLAEV